jgi:hypothetical protein
MTKKGEYTVVIESHPFGRVIDDCTIDAAVARLRESDPQWGIDADRVLTVSLDVEAADLMEAVSVGVRLVERAFEQEGIIFHVDASRLPNADSSFEK